MAGGRQNDVVTGHSAIIERRAVYQRIGDDTCDIVGWPCAFFRCQRRKIFLKAFDSTRDQLGDLVGAHIGSAAFVEVLILPTEHLLSQKQHARLVGLRHAQYLHHHMQRIGRGDQRNEIAFRAVVQQPVNGLFGECADVPFQRFQVLGHEP